MSTPAPILHHRPDSLESRRLQTVFAIKKVTWRSAEIGETANAVPGAAITRPVLQLGADFHAGGLATLLAIEALCPEPTLFPNGNRGMPLALGFWSNRFVEDFFAADGDPTVFDGHADLIERQLHDGRDFLQGRQAGLADAESFAAVSCCLAGDIERRSLAARFKRLPGWLDRMTALGNGNMCPVGPSDMADAIAAARAAIPRDGRQVRLVGTGSDHVTLSARLIAAERSLLTLTLDRPDGGAVRLIISRFDARIEKK